MIEPRNILVHVQESVSGNRVGKLVPRAHVIRTESDERDDNPGYKTESDQGEQCSTHDWLGILVVLSALISEWICQFVDRSGRMAIISQGKKITLRRYQNMRTFCDLPSEACFLQCLHGLFLIGCQGFWNVDLKDGIQVTTRISFTRIGEAKLFQSQFSSRLHAHRNLHCF